MPWTSILVAAFVVTAPLRSGADASPGASGQVDLDAALVADDSCEIGADCSLNLQSRGAVNTQTLHSNDDDVTLAPPAKWQGEQPQFAVGETEETPYGVVTPNHGGELTSNATLGFLALESPKGGEQLNPEGNPAEHLSGCHRLVNANSGLYLVPDCTGNSWLDFQKCKPGVRLMQHSNWIRKREQWFFRHEGGGVYHLRNYEGGGQALYMAETAHDMWSTLDLGTDPSKDHIRWFITCRNDQTCLLRNMESYLYAVVQYGSKDKSAKIEVGTQARVDPKSPLPLQYIWRFTSC